MFKNKKKSEVQDSIERILSKDTDFTTIETYKTIRTNVMFSLPKTEKGKVIAVTSSAPDEGKSTTSINLAITFAQMGAKVIIVDCDLRKARLHKYLGIKRNEGLSNVLCGFTELEKTIIHNVRDNLDILTAGEIPPNPAELLETDGFSLMLSALREKYDYIFVDTPPVAVVTDGIIVARQVDGIVLVVMENQTNFDELDEAVEALKLCGTSIIGTIVLGVEFKHKKRGYYKNGKYTSKYANKYKYKYDYAYSDNDETQKK